MISGVRASSIRIESTSSTIAKSSGALDLLRVRELHVVAQVVEAELVVRDVGDVGAVGGAARGVVEVVQDHAHLEAEEAVHLAHPLGVAAREVVVDGDDVHACPRARSGRRAASRRASCPRRCASRRSRRGAARCRRSAARRSGAGRARAWRPRARSRTPRAAGRRAARRCSTRSRNTPVRARSSASESFASAGSSAADLLDERDDPPDHPVVVAAEERSAEGLAMGVARRECTKAANWRANPATATAGHGATRLGRSTSRRCSRAGSASSRSLRPCSAGAGPCCGRCCRARRSAGRARPPGPASRRSPDCGRTCVRTP